MMQRNDVDTEITLSDGRRGRGRPAKPDALTPAERARRYREKHREMRAAGKKQRDGDAITDKTVAALQEQLLKLQMKYDLEHLAVIQLQTELANLKQTITKPAVNPLARQVATFKKMVAEQEKMISAYSAEINNLRDELRSSQNTSNEDSYGPLDIPSCRWVFPREP